MSAQAHNNHCQRPRNWRSAIAGLGLIALAASGAAPGAPLYKWVDERGIIHVSDERPPQGVDYKTLEVDTAPSGALDGGSAGQPSAALRQQRCQDFKGALTQLRGADNLPPDRSAWQAAKKRAKNKIQQWCREG